MNFAHPAIRAAAGSSSSASPRSTTSTSYDRATDSSPGFQVTIDAAAQRFPRVSGNVVVYEDYNANPNVASVAGCLIGTAGCTTFTVATVGRQPDIDGDNVVYVGKDAPAAIRSSSTTSPPRRRRSSPSAPSDKSQPRISGNRVVWADKRIGDFDIYSYDLTTKTETKIIGATGVDETLGDIDGDRVVYQTSTGAASTCSPSSPRRRRRATCPSAAIRPRPTSSTARRRRRSSTSRPVYAGHSFTTPAGQDLLRVRRQRHRRRRAAHGAVHGHRRQRHGADAGGLQAAEQPARATSPPSWPSASSSTTTGATTAAATAPGNDAAARRPPRLGRGALRRRPVRPSPSASA